jgi:uncharacterized phiE125 gp8 family phage protein
VSLCGQRHAFIDVTTAPASLPVTVEEFKTYARIDIDDDDDLCTALLTAATDITQAETQRSLITRTLTAHYKYWSVLLELPYPPVASVTSVGYLDADDTLTTIDASNYYTILSGPPNLIQFKDTYSFPTLSDRVVPIRVVFVTGTAAGSVPPQAKQAIKYLAKHFYDLREAVALAQMPAVVPRTFRSLVDSIRFPSLP